MRLIAYNWVKDFCKKLKLAIGRHYDSEKLSKDELEFLPAAL